MRNNLYLLILIMLLFFIPFVVKAQIEDCNNKIENGLFDEALKCLEKLPDTRENTLSKIYCYKSLREYTKAIILLEKLVEENSGDSALLMSLGNLYTENSNFSKSLACFEKLLEKDSTNRYFLLQKANALFDLEKYDLALDDYKKINDINKSNSSLKSIAKCYDNIGKQDSALVYYEQAYEQDSLDWFSAIKLIKNDILIEDYSSALALSDSYFNLDSTNIAIAKLRAYSSFLSKEYIESVSRFEQCLSKGDSSFIVNKHLGFSYYYLGADSLAIINLKRAYIQDTTDTNVMYTLGSIYQDKSEPQLAIKYFDKLAEVLLPYQNLLYYTNNALADSFLSLGKHEKAFSFYNKALLYTEDEAKKHTVYFKMADTYNYALQDKDKAVFFYKKYIDSLGKYKVELLKDSISNNEIIDKIEKNIERYKDEIAYISK